MQMRSCAVWCLTVIGLCALANPAWAAPKKKKKTKPAETAAAVETESAPESSDEPKDIDSLMSDSTKDKPAPVQKEEIAAPDPDKPLFDDEGSPDAWERPPADVEKPKKKKVEHVADTSPQGDGRNMAVGIVAGYGIALGSGLTALNPYGLGVGLQGVYELDTHWVVGIGGEFFLGEDDPNARDNNGALLSTFARYVLGHAIGGYNIWISEDLILRPTIWVGVAIAMVPKRNPHPSGIAATFMIGPGLNLHYTLGPTGWYTGVDVHYSWPWGQANSTRPGMPLLLTFGKRF